VFQTHTRIDPEEPISELAARLAAEPSGRIVALIYENADQFYRLSAELKNELEVFFGIATEEVSAKSDISNSITSKVLELAKLGEPRFISITETWDLTDEILSELFTSFARNRSQLVESVVSLLLWIQPRMERLIAESAPDLFSVIEVTHPGSRRVPADIASSLDKIKELEIKWGIKSAEFVDLWSSEGVCKLGEDAFKWLSLLEATESDKSK
jgi:hypothetical protein